MLRFDDTITAIATAPGTGAIAIVRLSGPDAWRIAGDIFVPAGAAGTTFRSHLARHGHIVAPDDGAAIDEVVLIPYKGPHSYTGEDLVEINCHGGSVVTNEILSLCLSSGARLARPGEFTQRAFMAGKMDLTQAEAVLDLIQAKTGRQGRLALSALSGHLGERIRSIRSQLLTLITRVVAGIDFPEEVGECPEGDIERAVRENLGLLEELVRTARSGRFLRDGLRLAIAGRPNAGKSSLLNQLLKFERAIVTEIPGTTRDSLEELLDINGIPVILIDTAGIRPTDDHVERMGIERTRAAIAQSDLVLFIVDLLEGWQSPEDEIRGIIGARPYILVGNKLDVAPDGSFAEMPDAAGNLMGRVPISARTGAGISDLTKCVESWVFDDGAPAERQPSLNSRQAELCARAAAALRLAQETVGSGLPQDCLATDLKAAVDALSEVCGEAVSEEVIHQVFANFCIGK